MQAAHSFNQKFILSTIINLPLAPTFSSFSKEGLQQKCFSKKFPKVKIYYLFLLQTVKQTKNSLISPQIPSYLDLRVF